MKLVSFSRGAALALLLTSVSAAQVGYVVDSNNDELYSIDLSSAALTLIGSTANSGLGTPAGLAWRSDTSTLWTIDLAGGELGTLDLNDATFNPVFQTNVSGWQGIAWDGARSLFILVNQNGDTYEFDPATGTVTILGGTGFGLITALDFDPTGDLWGIDFFGDIVSVDPVTGVGTGMGVTVNGVQGLAIDDSGIWYATDTNTDSLYVVDPVTGATTLIGAHGLPFVKGFEIPGAGGTFNIGSNYCNALANSTGQPASISATGSTVASANDVLLTASSMPPQQFGIFVTSLTQAATPVQSGILCVGGQIARFQGPGQIQMVDVNGEFSLQVDTTQIPAGTVPVTIQPGESWNFTAWFRDVSPSGNTANFSDGVEITFQ